MASPVLNWRIDISTIDKLIVIHDSSSLIDLKRTLTLLFTLTLLLSLSVSTSASVTDNSTRVMQTSDESALLKGVPYQWQEINGLCSWAATSMAFQYAGVDLDLHEIMAVTTIGFSFAYVRYGETLLMFPGAMYMQVEPTLFAAELFGLNFSVHFDTAIDEAEQLEQIWTQRGVTVGLLDGQEGALDLMRDSIDEGHPLIVSVDPIWLPADDYDVIRESGTSGGGHAILIVGYDDESGVATFMDPGVGSFGDQFGYPEDGRGNYSEITYTALINAWSERDYISMLIKPEGETSPTLEDDLGQMIRDKLLGVGVSYSAQSSTAYVWKFGESAFREMSKDVTPEGISTFLGAYDGVENEKEFKSTLILVWGLGLEAQVTLQHLSFRTSLESLPYLMPDTDLSDFVDVADNAIPHFEAISTNDSLIYLENVTEHLGPASTVFYDLAIEYNSSGDLEASLALYEEDLSEISGHLLGIADAWLAAGNELAEIWPNDFFSVYGLWIGIAAFGVGALVVLVVIWSRQQESQ